MKNGVETPESTTAEVAVACCDTTCCATTENQTTVDKLTDDAKIKELVKEKYSQIALQSKEENETSCCGTGLSCGEAVDYSIFAEDATNLAGYNSDADLGLGCGLPTQFAQIKSGDTVIDLGSGAGNDCFIARAEAGETGRVIGIDMTEAMIDKARKNTEKRGFTNIEFHLGDIENLPLEANLADVIVSNCVLNLVPNKQKAFSEVYRVLKSGGHFSISDVVLKGDLPKGLQEAAEMYAGCVAGAIQKEDYLGLIKQLGFRNIQVQKDRAIILPKETLANYLTEAQIADFQQSNVGIYSITVYADKP
jgi:ubiquinone/menaquinone biosynthesis C-methylase UbiE